MNRKYSAACVFILIQLFCSSLVGAQNNIHEHEDCNHNEAKSIWVAKELAKADSADWHAFKAPALIYTQPCLMPATVTTPVHFSDGSDKIKGYFDRVNNANVYLVVLHHNGIQADAPMNGRLYENGDNLGSGIVISCSAQPAFSIHDLKVSTQYGISIFAGNANCSNGVVYNKTPMYKGFRTTSATDALHHYFGNLHSHSKNSDGNKENTNVALSDNFSFAKDADCMDFLGISDHNHFSSAGNPGMRLANYRSGTQQTQAYNTANPNFLALYGMEYGVINNGGHVIVYGIDSLLGWETLSGSPNYDIYMSKFDYSGNNGLFRTIGRFGAQQAFGYFAHPDDNDYGNLLGISYSPLADSAIIGSAVENGPANTEATNYSHYPSSMSYLQYYRRMLAKGYHIGPIIDHDNHYFTFGRTARSRLVVLSASLSRNDFMEAMRKRSFYATQNCNTVLNFEVSGASMGSDVTLAGAPALFVSVADPSSNQTPTIRIYKGTNNGTVANIAATATGTMLNFIDSELQDGTAAYYFVDMSIGNSRTISSPVWYNRNDGAGTNIKTKDVPHQQITILQNPVTTQTLSFVVETEMLNRSAFVQIVDVYGRLYFDNNLELNKAKNSLDISALPAGTYILRVNNNSIQSFKKFVKY